MSLLGNSNGAVQFAAYEPMKRLWRRHVDTQASHSQGKEEKMGNLATLAISGGSKIFAGTVTYPYQVLRSRLQTYNAEETYGRGIMAVTRNIWRESGWRGFYRGCATNVVRVLPSTWVTFLVYENVRYYLSGVKSEDI